MLQKFNGLDYEKAKRKWFEGKSLTTEEISGLFAKIDALNDRMKSIRELARGAEE